MESCTKRTTATRASRKSSANHFGLLQCAFSAPIGGNLFFSEGVLILAGVIIDNAKYTSIVILIWISNSVVTVAEIISFDFD